MIESDTIGTAPELRTSTRLLDSDFHVATAALRPLTTTLFATPNDRRSRVLRLVDLSHEFGGAVAHDSAAAARTSDDPTQLAELARRAAAVARGVADDGGGLRQPCPPLAPAHDRRAECL